MKQSLWSLQELLFKCGDITNALKILYMCCHQVFGSLCQRQAPRFFPCGEGMLRRELSSYNQMSELIILHFQESHYCHSSMKGWHRNKTFLSPSPWKPLTGEHPHECYTEHKRTSELTSLLQSKESLQEGNLAAVISAVFWKQEELKMLLNNCYFLRVDRSNRFSPLFLKYCGSNPWTFYSNGDIPTGGLWGLKGSTLCFYKVTNGSSLKKKAEKKGQKEKRNLFSLCFL